LSYLPSQMSSVMAPGVVSGRAPVEAAGRGGAAAGGACGLLREMVR
jgi:hypothetical protein